MDWFVISVTVLVWVALEVIYYGLKFFNVLPIIKFVDMDKRRNNNLTTVKISTKIPGWKSLRGLLYQEIVEFQKMGLLIQRPFTFFSKERRRRVEYLGRASELVTAISEGKDEEEYLTRIVNDLTTYKIFKGVSEKDIRENVQLYKNSAQRYLCTHHSMLERSYNKLMGR